MERYQSKTVVIDRPAAEIFERFNRADSLTPLIGDRLEEWHADADTCSFRAQGFPIRVRITERVAPTLLKMASDQGTPFNFTVTAHLAEMPENKTELTMALEIELNMVMKMMIGPRLQQGADALVDIVAAYLNSQPKA
jgi:carbon monoxide dehydrogenase subunit G